MLDLDGEESIVGLMSFGRFVSWIEASDQKTVLSKAASQRFPTRQIWFGSLSADGNGSCYSYVAFVCLSYSYVAFMCFSYCVHARS